MNFNTLNASVISLIALLMLSACTPRQPVHQQQLLALGTLIDITIYGAEEENARQAIADVAQLMETLHHDWHAWQPSKLTEINRRLANGETVELDSEGQRLIGKGMELAAHSQNTFNPAVGKLIGLWGFHSDDWSGNQPPASEKIQALLDAAPQMSDLSLEEGKLSSANPAVELDLGAYAKGYAVDIAVAALRKRGIENAIINAGGNLRIIGKKGDRPWRIGVRDPRGTGVLAALDGQGDEAIITSGDYERYFDYQGVRYHHIIDPRSGTPARGAIATTVIAADGITADAASTALFIAGPEKWRDTARSLGIEQAMLIGEDGTIYLTAAMAKRIQFEAEPAPKSVIVP